MKETIVTCEPAFGTVTPMHEQARKGNDIC
jgi:hypothetical protein